MICKYLFQQLNLLLGDNNIESFVFLSINCECKRCLLIVWYISRIPYFKFVIPIYCNSEEWEK